MMVSDALALDPANLAVTLTVLVAETGLGIHVKFADFPPAATVIEAGPPQPISDAVNDAEIPPEGAGLLRTTVPVVVPPPTTLEGMNESVASFGQ